MMKLLRLRTGILILLMLCVLPFTGCAVMKDKPAAEDLSLVMAGMDGSDGVSFEGAAALLVGGKAVPESSIYYGGKVADHNKISLYSLLPDGGHPASAAESGPHPLGQGPGEAPVYYTRLVKEDGTWTMKQGSPALAGSNPLEALNPLRQLEDLERLDKKVTEEAGSARGTRVLRIELTAEAARSQLSAELEREMQAIRPVAGSGAVTAAGTHAEALEAKTALWEQKQSELQQRLDQADIRTIYYLKVDPKRNLPARLTWNRTLTYLGKAGTTTEETYITQVDFYGYQ
ncbi:hypothetical protein HQN87_00635 [Paenibacillus tritici]|uniref:Lipoprotein n=1 Tax=Paenibacillus tritici TaxID=1873425 RepID=A0ABX2DH28_9BACL|nr:hypothetical protein [Paenibacillus tritici]NQX43820.1 hypothetical protein [Paenibacillus tritici]